MPREEFYIPKTPTLESPGEKSLDLSDALSSGDYGQGDGHVQIKAIYVGGAGDIVGFKERDELTGTARTWKVVAGTYLLGPFAQIKQTGTNATNLIAEYF